MKTVLILFIGLFLVSGCLKYSPKYEYETKCEAACHEHYGLNKWSTPSSELKPCSELCKEGWIKQVGEFNHTQWEEGSLNQS